jgi:SAM-dependent methyltransferase
MTSSPVYDTIGQGYLTHRRAEPRWESVISRHIGDADLIVNVGAGTGSYEPPGRSVLAVDPSSVMLGQRAPGSGPAVRASASALPLRSASADVAMAILTVHHWDDWERGLSEMCRVAPRRLVLGIDFDRHASFWLLEDYLPEVAAYTRSLGPDVDAVASTIGATSTIPLLVPAGMVDGVLGAYWCRPEAYLDPAVRANCSGLALADPSVIARGVAALAADIESGAWQQRHAGLLALDALDLGYRLVVAG